MVNSGNKNVINGTSRKLTEGNKNIFEDIDDNLITVEVDFHVALKN